MRRTSKTLAPVLTLLMLSGCVSPTELAESLVPAEEDEKARRYLELLRKRDYEPILSALDPAIDSPQEGLETMSDIMGEDAPLSVTRVGSHDFKTPDLRRVTLTYQLELPEAWILAWVVFTSRGDDQRITTFRIQPIVDSLENLHAFSLRNAGVLHYVFLVLVSGIPILIIFSVIQLFRTKIPRRWLWLIFILLGFVQLNLNWTTGEVGFRLLSFVLLGVGMARASLYSPWIVNVSIPIGALIFLAKRRSITRAGMAAPCMEEAGPGIEARGSEGGPNGNPE